MSAAGPVRPLALVLSRLGGQARAGLIDALPPAVREQVLAGYEAAERLDRADMSVVEQVLAQELDRLLGDAEDPAEFREAFSLRVADLVALVLLNETPARAAAVLSHLPHTVQSECIHTIAARDWEAVEGHLGADERGMIRDLDAALGGQRSARHGQAVAILRQIGSSRQLRALLTDIHHRDSETAKAIQASLYSIEDLRQLSDRELQTLTTGIDDWDLAIAFLGMSDGLRRRILSNVSRRRAAFLESDAEYLEDSTDEDVEAVSDRILMRARMLYEAGQLQTYLGSVSAEPVDPEEEPEDDAAPAPRKRTEPVEVDEAAGRRSWRGPVFAVVALMLVAGLWHFGVGTGPSRTRSNARISASDFARGQREAKGGGNAVAGSGGESKATGSGVSATEGDVFVISGHERRAIEESTLERGDVVETEENGRALITLSGDGSKLEVEEETTVQLGERDEPAGPPKLSVRVGNVWLLVRNPALVVDSPVVSVTASSGALYRFRVVLSSATTVSVESGTAWVRSKVGDRELVVVGAGKALRVEPRGSVDLTDIDDGGTPRWLSLF